MHGCHTAHVGHGAPRTAVVHGMCDCGCGQRRFLNRNEKVEMLEEYRESLKSELEGVEEALKELKREL